MSNAQAPNAQIQPILGGFGLPGVTQWTEQQERTQELSTSLSQAQSTKVIGIQEMLDTDVVFAWDLITTLSQAVTAGVGQTIQTSPFYPYNWLERLTLKVQQQYDLIDLSGIMASIFQSYRPFPNVKQAFRNNLTANPAQNFANSNYPQSTQQTPPGLSTASTSIPLHFELPCSMHFDRYCDLDIEGNILSPPSRAYVSPQFMAGSVRNVQLGLKWAPGFGSGLDDSPFNTTDLTAPGDTASTIVASVIQSINRRGIYAPSLGAEPPLYAWQYQRTSSELGVEGTNNWPVASAGQVLSIVGRIWDPSANAGLGAPVNLSTVEQLNLLYGSKLLRFQDDYRSMQYRFLAQHGFLPPVGTFIWDLATDDSGQLTNERAINTLTTAGITVNCKFNSGQAPSALSYVELGVEALTFVSPAANASIPTPVG